jgi:hypothetical protein
LEIFLTGKRGDHHQQGFQFEWFVTRLSIGEKGNDERIGKIESGKKATQRGTCPTGSNIIRL